VAGGFVAAAELVVRMALNRHSKNRGRYWDARVKALMAELNINTTAKTTKLVRRVQSAGKAVETWAAGNGH
jgi:hypothetical protein